MAPLDDGIYGNIGNNNGHNDESSLNELKDLAIEISDEEIKIDDHDDDFSIGHDDLLDLNVKEDENDNDFAYNDESSYDSSVFDSDGFNDINSEINTNDLYSESLDFKEEENILSPENDYIPSEIGTKEYEAIPHEDIENEMPVDFQAESQQYQNINNNNFNQDIQNETINEMPIDFQAESQQYQNINNNNFNQDIQNETINEMPIDFQAENQQYQNVNNDNFNDDEQNETYEYNENENENYNNKMPGSPIIYDDETNIKKEKKKKGGIIPLLLLALISVGIFYAVINMPQVKEKISGIYNQKEEAINDSEEIANFTNVNNKVEEQNQTVKQNDKKENKRAKMVVFDEDNQNSASANVKICANPFLPTIDVDAVASSSENENALGAYEIISPPSGSEINEGVTEVSTMMETKVSGILYDNDNPQAILNYDGQDQLVSRGDRLGGFYIMSITPDKVILKQGNNVYRVSVGQSVTDEGINYNKNSNLGKQFGGRYTDSTKEEKIINMNE